MRNLQVSNSDTVTTKELSCPIVAVAWSIGHEYITDMHDINVKLFEPCFLAMQRFQLGVFTININF